MFKRYPFIKQEGLKDCGVFSLLMIIKYYNGNVSVEQLRDMTKTTKNGTTAYHLLEAAKKVGLNAKGIKCKIDDLKTDKVILPAIAHVTINNSYNHYIVIYEINFKKQTILIADPATKMKKISFDEFHNIWNNVLIILYPQYKLPLYNNNLTFKYFLTNILKVCKSELKYIVALSIFMIFFSIFVSFYLKYIINGVSLHKPKEYLLFLFILFLNVHLLKIITEYYRNNILVIINKKIDALLTTETFYQIILLPYLYYCNRTTGEIIARINDLSNMRVIISKVIYVLFIDLPLTIVSFVILFFINSKLFIIALILLILYTLNLFIFKPFFEKYIDNIQNQKALVTSYMVESISGYETIKGLSIEAKTIKFFNKKYINLITNVQKLDEIYNLQYLIKEIINNVGFITIIFIGSLLVIEKTISIGDLLTFNALLTYFLGPIRNVVDMDITIKESKNSLKRVLNLFYDKKETGIIKSGARGDIIISNLNYTYNDHDYILKNINLEIKQGEKTLIVGSSGSGKSTLLKLIMKYYDTTRGSIIINNIDINDYHFSSYKKSISYISQKEILFTNTLEYNLKIASNCKSFYDVSKLCEVDSIIKNCNTGYKMLIEENGYNISGGEKQRIILARALLKQFNILIIDEGLNEMDINLERRILKRIFSKFSNKTIIIVTHRLENMDLFDKVIELEKGIIKNVVYKNG